MTIVVNDLRSLRHDMNNHMSVLQGLLAMQEYDDAKNYLSTITEELAVANSFIFTDNKVLSVMLNNKISKAHQFGITFDTELLTSTTPFSDSDLCAVVGNKAKITPFFPRSAFSAQQGCRPAALPAWGRRGPPAQRGA